jgi:predicted regulator of amino acid metabolism with ACT domain
MISASELEELEYAKIQYITAKVIYDEKLKALKEKMKPIDELLEKGKITDDEFIEKEIKAEDEAGTWTAYQNLTKAEEKLIQTARPLLLQMAKPENKEALEMVFNCKFRHIREQIIDLILRWDATT